MPKRKQPGFGVTHATTGARREVGPFRTVKDARSEMFKTAGLRKRIVHRTKFDRRPSTVSLRIE